MNKIKEREEGTAQKEESDQSEKRDCKRARQNRGGGKAEDCERSVTELMYPQATFRLF